LTQTRSLFLFGLTAGLLLAASQAGAFCFEDAAARYDLPPALLRTIAQTETGLDPNAAGRNVDGSVDVGPMQINSWWEDRLGTARWMEVCTDPCYNVMVGAWILRDCLDRYGYSFDGIGCYNARSPEKRERYTRKILRVLLDELGRNRTQGRDGEGSR